MKRIAVAKGEALEDMVAICEKIIAELGRLIDATGWSASMG